MWSKMIATATTIESDVKSISKKMNYDFSLALKVIEKLEEQAAQSQNPAIYQDAIKQVLSDNLAVLNSEFSE